MPLLNVFLAVVIASVVLGILINATPLHTTLYGFAQKGQLPLIGQSYEHIMDHHEDAGVARGKVISIEKYSFQIQHNDRDKDKDDGNFSISVPQDGSIPLPHVGDEVLIFGEPAQGNVLMAKNIQVLPPMK